jgi:hypothetical protein
MAIQRSMERGKAVPRRAVFGMISAMEAIGLTRDLPIAGAQERAEEAGLSNTPSPFAGFLSTVTQTTRSRLPRYPPLGSLRLEKQKCAVNLGRREAKRRIDLLAASDSKQTSASRDRVADRVDERAEHVRAVQVNETTTCSAF